MQIHLGKSGTRFLLRPTNRAGPASGEFSGIEATQTWQQLNCREQAITLIDPGAPKEGGFECNRDVSPIMVSHPRFIDRMLRTLRAFGGRTARDTKDVIESRPAERQLRCRLGYQSLPKPHIHGPRRNKRHCILPSTLAARPTWFVMHGQQRSLCLECFPA